MPPMSQGSRTAGYAVCLFLATPLVFLYAVGWLSVAGAVAVIVTMWTIALTWVLRKRSEDPGWDRREA
jgi:hypothetical protein